MTLAGAELIQKMAGGDRAAFAAFYDRYAPLVYPLIVRIVRGQAEAADVVQEVFWETWRTAGSYDPARGTPEAWLLTRARTRAIDRVRSIRRRSETFVDSAEPAPVARSEAPAAEAAVRAEGRGVLRSALGQLPEAQQEVIALAYYEGLTQTEIAQRLKQPLGTVKTRIRLALERLRATVKAT